MFSQFDTEIPIRPDDIDMNNHVHNTKYLDYVLAARYIQMTENYKMPMDQFADLNYNLVISTSHIDFKRALKVTDKIIVRTQIDSISGAQCKVNFWVLLKSSNKISAEGYIVYTLISLTSGRPVRIPEAIIEVYSV
jgi:YbgC/YbaW family acyl-CoA thioester hydrolase